MIAVGHVLNVTIYTFTAFLNSSCLNLEEGTSSITVRIFFFYTKLLFTTSKILLNINTLVFVLNSLT